MSGDSITTPQNFQPSQGSQSLDASNYQAVLGDIENQITSGTTPGQVFWPAVQTATTNAVNNPYTGQAVAGAQSGAAAGTGVQSAGIAGMNQLTGGAAQILNTGFDPQQALYNQQQGQVIEQTNVANAMAGLGSSPYGASNTANTLGNFDINWQNNELARQQQALGAAGTAIGTGIGAGQTGINTGVNTAAAPSGAYNTAQTNSLSALTSGISAGNQQYTVPQTVLSDLMGYLNLGQSASQTASGINAQNLANTNSIFSGLGSLAGTGLGLVDGGIGGGNGFNSNGGS